MSIQYEELLKLCYALCQNGQTWMRKIFIHRFKLKLDICSQEKKKKEKEKSLALSNILFINIAIVI